MTSLHPADKRGPSGSYVLLMVDTYPSGTVSPNKLFLTSCMTKGRKLVINNGVN